MHLRLLALVLLTLVFPQSKAIAQGEAISVESARPGSAPLITMEQAVEKAKAYIAEKHIGIDKAYLQAAIFHPYTMMNSFPTHPGARDSEANGRSWEIIWQVPNAKGGTTTVYVFEDNTFRVTYGE